MNRWPLTKCFIPNGKLTAYRALEVSDDHPRLSFYKLMMEDGRWYWMDIEGVRGEESREDGGRKSISRERIGGR